MTLIADAERAEDIADALSKFKVPVPDQGPEITASISELYAIGSALRDIDTALNSDEYGRNYRLIEKDLDLACSSLNTTIEDIFRILGDIGNGAPILNDGMYRQTWKEIVLFFMQNGRISLRTRLEKYKRFIVELAGIVKRFVDRISRHGIAYLQIYRRGPRTSLVGDLRGDIQGLAPPPDRLSEALNNMTLGPRGTQRSHLPSSPADTDRVTHEAPIL
jgi:hypothetical protein